ncbi:MAG: tRNA lysidine(34) synthetase TilS [Spiribacter salinus]|uniref:tRNA(Ile)-lysidine synthase n=1 Tax=Spiribacter salinus TaxID=1335746 RepID=A0A540VUC2_9GAMM|nr:MAG: tRNA lysidine(34) synthetase TilS [Spiribacter salinus]
MTLPTPADVVASLPSGVQRLVVAFSGGLDSTVLLDLACASGRPVLAVHVHHGLAAAADDWVTHCESVCQAAGVDLRVERVHVDAHKAGVQAGARAARYAALADALQAGDALLTAHHAEDQAETVLLRLLRGTGVDGLGAMSPCQSFGVGSLIRPLLAYRRAELAAYAEARGLHWVDDPGNASLRYDRVRVRQHLLPTLESEWPGVVHALNALAHDARADREARGLLLAPRLEAALLEQDGPMRVSGLAAEPPVIQCLMLREWLRSGGIRPPGRRRLEASIAAFVRAAPDRAPEMSWPEGRVARFGDQLYRLPVAWPSVPDNEVVKGPEPRTWPGLGALSWRPVAGQAGLVPTWLDAGVTARVMRPGDRLQIPGRPRRALKSLFREAGIPPWWRLHLPILVDAVDQPLAVPGIGVDARAAASGNAVALAPVWAPAERPDAPDWHYFQRGA